MNLNPKEKIGNQSYMHFSNKTKKLNSGYTLLLSVIISGVVLTIGFGIANILEKEILLSQIARKSQVAFYAADTGAECALFWDKVHPGFGGSVFIQDLVAHWEFDETSGSIAFDRLGNFNGTIQNGVQIGAAGKLGTAYHFDGVDDYVEIGDFFEDLSEGTISFWVKPDVTITSGFTGDMRPWGKGGIDDPIFPGGHLEGEWSSNSGVFVADIGNDFTIISNQFNWDPTTWYHILVKWNSASSELWVDGVLDVVRVGGVTPEDTDNPFVIGASSRTGVLPLAPFQGFIDEFRVYDRALESQEILKLATLDPSAGTKPTPQGSNIMCNMADVSDPQTGWRNDPLNDWVNQPLAGEDIRVTFDMEFADKSCALVTIIKDSGTQATTIESRGYNVCTQGAPRRVERAIRVLY
jgi:hypothetical protein